MKNFTFSDFGEVWLCLPASFSPREFLPTMALARRADDARWLLHTILTKTTYRDLDSNGCVRLHSAILRRIMDNRAVATIIKSLEDGGAIETAPYRPRVQATGFRLGRRYLADRHVRVQATDQRLIRRIEQERERLREAGQGRWRPIHYDLDAEQQHVTITAAADPLVDALPWHARLCQDVLVGNLKRRTLPFSVSSTGRCFNAITGLKRTLRPTLRIDGQPIGGVDLRCAQPGLLAMLIAKKRFTPLVSEFEMYNIEGNTAGCPYLPLSRVPAPAPDVAAFVSCAGDGSLYDLLVSSSGLERSLVKRGMLVDVLAKQGSYPSEVEDAFRQAFPSVHAIVRDVNRDDHGTLIRLLQRAESWLVIDCVAPKLIDSGTRCVTLHDAIYSQVGSVSAVEAAFRETFAELGIRLALSTEGA